MNLEGTVFGRWNVISRCDDRLRPNGDRIPIWLCRCQCGTEKPVTQTSLRSGASKSCGCMKVEMFTRRLTKHGRSFTSDYTAWSQMRQRCSNPNSEAYKNYGGLGVTVCERWNSFENFVADMGLRPWPNATIERKDPNGHYEPSNCKWASHSEQANNKRHHVLIEWNGKVQNAAQWEKEFGWRGGTIARRINDKGWPTQRAMTQVPMPIGKHQRIIRP